MSKVRHKRRPRVRGRAILFAALGDETRLLLLNKLSRGEPRSITHLAEGSPLSRQAISKHLRVLEDARLVRGAQVGRESMFELRPEALDGLRDYLERVSADWDRALARLKAFVEA